MKPDIRAITRLVPPSGNLVQGQSELPIDPILARRAYELISGGQNHYGGSEGDENLRRAVISKVAKYNSISIDPDARPFELLITNGGTGALVEVAQCYLKGYSALVFEPYYPYHRHIVEEFGGKIEVFELDEDLEFEKGPLFERCRELAGRSEYPLKAVIICTPANPSGKVMTKEELSAVSEVCSELDLLCVSDEVYEHFVDGNDEHIPIASLPGMWDRTITVNSFSKSWNVSGWRLGYVFGKGELLAPLNKTANVIYVCPSAPLQAALAEVLMADDAYYKRLGEDFEGKRSRVAGVMTELGFDIHESGSTFYIWARIPEPHSDAIPFNEMLLEKAGVAGVPGASFADSDRWDPFLRVCVAREDHILEGALERFRSALA